MITRRILKFAVVVFLCSSLPAYAIQPVYTPAQKQVLKIKEALQKLGPGDIHVDVKTRDGKIISGRLAGINNRRLGVMDLRQGTVTDVNLENVSAVQANNLSTGAKIGIGVGAAAAVWLLSVCGMGERGFCRN